MISEIAHATSLTIFAGAGVSLDKGSPDWDGLIVGVTAAQLAREGTDPDDARRSAELFLAQVGRFEAASAAKRVLRTEKALRSEICHQLYDDWAEGGPLAASIAELALYWKIDGRDVAVITTNYDDNIETAGNSAAGRHVAKLAAEFDITMTSQTPPDLRPNDNDFDVRALGREVELQPGEIPVYHLHGLLRRYGRHEGDIIFCERDFVLAGLKLGTRRLGSRDWRAQLILRRLRNSTCLFIGTSLTDPNVVRHLIDTRDSQFRRFGVFARQGDAWVTNPDANVQGHLDQLFRRRLEHLAVVPVRPNFFGQHSQFLKEIALSVTGAADNYTDRLATWWGELQARERDVEGVVPQDRFQEELSRTRDELVHRIEQCLPNAKQVDRLHGEFLKIELWVRREPAKSTATLWATSAAAWREEESLHSIPIENNSGYVAAQAFCVGHVIRTQPVPGYVGRWRTFISTPVVLYRDPWLRLPVGMITLMSTGSGRDSVLDLLSSARLVEIGRRLEAAGQELLDPSSRWWAAQSGRSSL